MNEEIYLEALKKISGNLTGIFIEDMSKAEKNIAKILVSLHLLLERAIPDHIYEQDTLGER